MKVIFKKKKNVVLLVIIILVAVFLVWQILLRDKELFGTATLTWNASAENDVAGYVVYYGTEKRTGNCPQGGYAKKIEVGNGTSYRLNNLKDGTTYYFSVASRNSAGRESCFSPEMSKTIKITIFDKLKSIL